MIIFPTITRVKIHGNQAIAETATALLKDSEGNQWGGGPSHTTTVDPRTLWTRKERAQWRDFLYHRNRYESEQGVEKELVKEEMMNRFGTTSSQEYATVLNMMMTADPRLTVKTRRGTVRTTVEGQAIFAHKAVMENPKNE